MNLNVVLIERELELELLGIEVYSYLKTGEWDIKCYSILNCDHIKPYLANITRLLFRQKTRIGWGRVLFIVQMVCEDGSDSLIL